MLIQSSALPFSDKELTRALCQETAVCSAMPCNIFTAAQEDAQLLQDMSSCPSHGSASRCDIL